MLLELTIENDINTFNMSREDQIKYAEQIIACGCSDELKAILEKDFPELTLDKDKRIKEVLSRNLEGNARFRWEIQRIGLHPDDVLFLIKSRSIEWQDDYCEEDLKTRFAFYMYKDEPNVLFLSNLFVEEASRNKGFGTKILIAAEKVAEVIGASCIRLKVKQNTSANAWYRKKGYGYMSSEDGYDWLEKTLEYMKPAKWSEEDKEKIGRLRSLVFQLAVYTDSLDVNRNYCDGDYAELDDWLKCLPNRFQLQPKQEGRGQLDCTPLYTPEEVRKKIQEAQVWSEEDEKRIKQLIYDTEFIKAHYEKRKEKVGEEFTNALIMDCDEQIAWLKSLSLNLKKRNEDIEKLCSNEWNEEDERMLSRCIKSIETSKSFADSETFKSAKDKEIDWLKSRRHQPNQDVFLSLGEKEIICLKRALDYLRKEHNRYGGIDFTNEIAVLEWFITHPVLAQQPHWKPSEEQMEALLNIEGDLRAFQYNDKAKIIAELYEQLKRL